MSVLIVKIIPGREFISNHFSPACVPPWPSQDHHSSLLSSLLSSDLPDEASERGAALLDLQQQIIVKSNKPVDRGRSAPNAPNLLRAPRCRQTCVLNDAQTSSLQCQRPPACSQGRPEVIRLCRCSGASVCKAGPLCAAGKSQQAGSGQRIWCSRRQG